MKEDQVTKSLFRLDLGSNGGLFEPRTADEIENWIKKEYSLWSGGTPPLWVSNALGELELLLDTIESMMIFDTTDEQYKNLKKRLESIFISTGLPHSKSRIGEILSYRKKQGKELSDAYLHAFLSKKGEDQHLASNQHNQADIVAGYVDRHYATSPIYDVDLQTKLLKTEELLEQLTLELEESKNNRTKSLRDLNEATRKFNESRNKVLGDFDEAMQSFNEGVSKSNSKIELMEKSVNEKIALHKTYQYWQEKQSAHKELAKKWLYGTFSSLAGAVAILCLVSWILFGERATSDPTSPNNPIRSAPEVAHWKIALFALIAVFVFWCVRIIVRQFMSNEHLQAEAAERIVMTQTFLGLLAAGHLATKDRNVILHSLFRNSQSGMIKDEAAPPTVGEWITRTGKF